MQTFRRKTEGKKYEPKHELRRIETTSKDRLYAIPEQPLLFKIDLGNSHAPKKPTPVANIDPAPFHSGSQLNFILTPQLQSQHHNTVPLIAEEDSLRQTTQKPPLSNIKKQSGLTAKTRNSQMLPGCLTTRAKQIDISKQLPISVIV